MQGLEVFRTGCFKLSTWSQVPGHRRIQATLPAGENKANAMGGVEGHIRRRKVQLEPAIDVPSGTGQTESNVNKLPWSKIGSGSP